MLYKKGLGVQIETKKALDPLVVVEVTVNVAVKVCKNKFIFKFT